jgi:hypothetical protein
LIYIKTNHKNLLQLTAIVIDSGLYIFEKKEIALNGSNSQALTGRVCPGLQG